MTCKYCGCKVSDDTTICPHCCASIVSDKPKTVDEKIESKFSEGVSVGKSGKSKLVAGLFAILLGGIGVHHFYMGNVGLGVVDILFSWTGIPSILGLVNGIIYLTESDDSFDSRIKDVSNRTKF